MKKLTIILAIVIIAIVILLILKNSFDISFEPVVSNIKFKRKTIYEKFKVKVVKIGENYGVFIENIVASSADMNNRHIKVDLYIETEDKSTTKLLAKNREQTVYTIADVMTNFKTSDLSTPNGKRFFKEQIKRALELKYGKEKIKNIYLHNMVFN
ncbi:flagellar basal body-associated FliL family protein [Deferribacter autotrophicus]|uniref:Flagellar protein FliL n=1 Tax=Deferribacter autotrophicus TaxID=500465 RepID=A0A5A8F595_9BACT|nr:flagellar basal body-associated FliL family protein [Deferribacter autotrophicus]KAA0258676.1 flagellar basal body-associated FliL family protein [Deferribacter autotrophicus]